ncbi:MAG TPA: lysophospholipid acyltransferase family protein [Phycisphaerae bacterium]|nr:lysophospholipid acyltransferase family protein [Phycisphaerae bacterium]
MRKQNPALNLTTYLMARWAVMMLGFFPVNANLRTARAFGSLMWAFDKKHRDRALENLTQSFPDKPRAELERIARRSIEHFCELGIDVMFTTRVISVETWHRFVHPKNFQSTVDIVLRGNGAILLTGHYGNWEILGYTLAVLGIRTYSVVRPFDNPHFDTWLLGVREKKGQIILSKRGVTTTAQEVLANKGILGFIADQNAGPKGMFVPFFGKLASTYKSIGLLAMQYNVPIIIGYARRRGDNFDFEVGVGDIIYPEDWKNQPDELYYITERYTRAIEMIVREDPTQYLWIHRRWKTRPKDEIAETPGQV